MIGERPFQDPTRSKLSQEAQVPPEPSALANGASPATTSAEPPPEGAEVVLPPLTSESFPWTGPQPALLQQGRPSAGRRHRRGALANSMVVLDLALTMGMLEVAEAARHLFPLGLQLPKPEYVLPSTLVSVLLIWFAVFHAAGVYDPQYQDSILNPWRVLWATLLSAVLFSGSLYVLNYELPRLLFVYFIVGDVLALLLLRLALWRLVKRAAWYQRRVLLLGGGPVAREAARMVSRHREAGLHLVGYVSDTETEALLDPEEPEMPALPHLGTLAATPAVLREREIDDVIITLPWREREQTERLVRHLDRYAVQVRVIPDYRELSTRLRVEDFGGLPLISLNEAAITGWQARMKRALDIVVASLLLVVLLPVLVGIAGGICLDSWGAPLFCQKRVGQYHRIFTIYKFRTMVRNAETLAEQVAQEQEGVLVHKRRRDPRVTRVGAFLRKTSLDELPQLVNVLKGDMSLVGPRPELPWLVVKYAPWQYRRFMVPQGITGWWQVNGRSDRPMHLHTEDDLFYIRNYSLWLDLKILLLTLKVVLTGKGAY